MDRPRRGPRVSLRILRPADRDEFAALKLANRSFLRAWEPTPSGGAGPFSPEAIDRTMRSARTRRSRRFAIILDGRIIGQISLSDIVAGPLCSCYVGYWIGRRHTRRGFMTEALALALSYAFERLGLHRVEANIIPSNAPSKALVKKLGFRREGLARRYLRIDGRWRDHERWAMTAEEWPQRRRKLEKLLAEMG